MIKYSIIVPIYNIEKYIEECILSVINQSYKNYELVLVDDGSLDNSGIICDNYAKKYKKIKVIHKKNGGLSDARNAGIKISTGEYVLFLDGDDTLYNNCLEEINSQLSDDSIDLLDDIPWSAWRNIYKREIFKEYSLEFEKGLIGAEDCEFFIRFFEKAKVKKYSNICIVNYRTNREDSITNKISYKAIIGELNVFSKYFYKFYELKNKTIYSLFANKYLNTITTINYIKNKEQINTILKHINNNKTILNYSKGLKYTFVKIIWKMFGYRLGTKIIRIIK